MRMTRRRFVQWSLCGGVPLCADAASSGAAGNPAVEPLPAGAASSGAAAYPAVAPGRELRFPDDEGSHPDFRIEWWYATGWLFDDARQPLGFQITFFRNRAVDTRGNPSRFAPGQLIVAHAALSDPQRPGLLHDQRVARAGFGLAEAAAGKTDVSLGPWSLRATGDALQARAAGRDFALDLTLRRTQAPLLHGEQGFSRKGPGAGSASYYYTLPHLAVTGRVTAAATTRNVSGTAWLDHEWSSAPMETGATGWDWIGINLDDGGALMAFRMRAGTNPPLWSGATLRDAGGQTRTYTAEQVRWSATRQWRSARTGATYPVAWRIEVGTLEIQLEPLQDDQELDARASAGTIYWEGAVTARAAGRVIGRGYLELTGYWRAFRL